MEVMRASIDNKMSKADATLSELNKEISLTFKFLQQLKKHSMSLVEKLNKITSRPIYLKEFVEVNSFLLRYISFLMEINCKFEIMQLSDDSCGTNGKSDRLKVHSVEEKSGKALEELEVKTDLNTSNLLSLEESASRVVSSLSIDVGDIKIEREEVEMKEPEREMIDEANTKNLPQVNDCFIKSSDKDNDHGFGVISFTSEVSNDVNPGLNEADSNNMVRSPIPLSQSSPTPDLGQKEVEPSEIKPLDIQRKVGDLFDVVVEHITSPSEFYVYFLNVNLNVLSELEKKLKSIPAPSPRSPSHKGKDSKALLQKEMGNYALYYSKCDEFWCRAQVTNWCINYDDNLVQIFLIDYGESKCVSVNALKPLPECLKKYPAFAQRCHLYGVCPVDVKEKGQMLWGKEAREKMRYFVENSEELKIKIAPEDSHHPPSSLPVTLWLIDKGNACVNKLLIDSKYAIEGGVRSEKTEPDYLRENKMLEKWNPMKDDFESYQNSYDLDVNDPAALIYGYVGRDYERICIEYARTGDCFKGASCRKEHKFLDPSGFTTDQEEVYKNAFNFLNSPLPKQILHVQVTCILKLNEFYCIGSNGIRASDDENLFTLVAFMNTEENVREMKRLLIPPSVGQIVIAKYSEDKSWYRAKILESQPENDLFTVIFVDYGNKETLPMSRIRAIEAKYLHLPFQAMQCYIYGIERNPNVSSKDGLEYLNAKLGNGLVNIEVVYKLPGDEVCLFVKVFSQDGQDIGLDLIEKDYAVYKQELLGSNECQILPG